MAAAIILFGVRISSDFTTQTPHLFQRSVDELSIPFPTNAPMTNRALQAQPPTQPPRPLCSVIGPPRSMTQSQPSGRSNERRWSVRGGKPQPAPLQSENVGRILYDCASGLGTATIAEPQGVLLKGSVQRVVGLERQGPPDQV